MEYAKCNDVFATSESSEDELTNFEFNVEASFQESTSNNTQKEFSKQKIKGARQSTSQDYSNFSPSKNVGGRPVKSPKVGHRYYCLQT